MPIEVELIHASAHQQSVLENLLQLYIHDFSELIPQNIGDDGRYSYRNLTLYWSDPSRVPFLARFGGKLAGFVLVTISELSGNGESYDMAEFFVLRSYRRRGIGRVLAERVWLRFPGRWQIRVVKRNAAALRFWTSSISNFTQRSADFTSYEIGGTQWHQFTFDSRRSEQNGCG